MIKKNLSILVAVPLILVFLYYASKFNNPLNGSTQNSNNTIHFSSDVTRKKGMVSSASKFASEVGIDILKRGGNAVDAAVAMGFVLAVTYPQAGNIGGGGFMVIRTNDTVTTIDYREKAPSGSTRNMFLDASGKFIPEKSQEGHLSAGVPGSVAGLLYALEKYGSAKMKREDVIQPAIYLAENGFSIEQKFAESLNSNYDYFRKYPSTNRTFTKSGSKYTAGELFVQKELANTLKLISIHGKEGFYSGITAELIEKEMQRGAGIITKDDLLNYAPVERNPVHTNYKGYDVFSMGPPSSGGIALIQLLNMIEKEPLPDKNSVYYGAKEYSDYLHIVFESMKRVYADRSEHLGDPDFWKVPVSRLIDKNYSEQRRKEIGDNATPPSDIKAGAVTVESDQTTHYSVIDKDGIMVSVTTTLNNTYGSGVVVDGAGFFLNDEMDDFSSKPGEPNMYGLVGNEANAIDPNKRMLSSMTPTIILKDGNPFMILGSPGGGRIITSVFQTITSIIDFNMSLDSAIDVPRYHHQWLPEYVQYESGAFTDAVITKLQEKGHQLKQVSDFGRIEGILVNWKEHDYFGHSDRRGYGLAIGY